MNKEKVWKFPKLLGTCVDRLDLLQKKMDELTAEYEAATAPLKEEYKALESHLIDTIPKAKLDGALGKTAMATIERSPVPNVTDWVKFRAYIVKNEAWELIQKRTSVVAFRERWDAKQTVPGVEVFVKLGLKLKPRK